MLNVQTTTTVIAKYNVLRYSEIIGLHINIYIDVRRRNRLTYILYTRTHIHIFVSVSTTVTHMKPSINL